MARKSAACEGKETKVKERNGGNEKQKDPICVAACAPAPPSASLHLPEKARKRDASCNPRGRRRAERQRTGATGGRRRFELREIFCSEEQGKKRERERKRKTSSPADWKRRLHASARYFHTFHVSSLSKLTLFAVRRGGRSAEREVFPRGRGGDAEKK